MTSFVENSPKPAIFPTIPKLLQTQLITAQQFSSALNCHLPPSENNHIKNKNN